MDPRSISTPMVRPPPKRPKPLERPITPKLLPDRDDGQHSAQGTTEGTQRGRPALSSALPGNIPECAHLYAGIDGGLALDAGVGAKDDPRPDACPCPNDRAGGDPGPSPHLRVPV